jgi:uncharacterized protein
MLTLDLPPSYIETVRRLLASHVPVAEVWAYGSRISGQAHDGSDLDLVVRDPEDPSRPQRDLWELREAFSESEIPILVDVFDWARIPEEFRSEIARSHVVIWEGSALGEEGSTDQHGRTRT